MRIGHQIAWAFIDFTRERCRTVDPRAAARLFDELKGADNDPSTLSLRDATSRYLDEMERPVVACMVDSILGVPKEITEYQDRTDYLTWHLETHHYRHYQDKDEEARDFFAFHRALLEDMRERFPQHAGWLRAWREPFDTDPEFRSLPMALQRDLIATSRSVASGIDSIESLRDLTRALQVSAGGRSVHDEVHDYFSGSALGPFLGPEHRLFWQLHAWIDAVCERYFAAHGKPPSFDAAVKQFRRAVPR